MIHYMKRSQEPCDYPYKTESTPIQATANQHRSSARWQLGITGVYPQL